MHHLMEVRCLNHPGASAIGSQLLHVDGDHSHALRRGNLVHAHVKILPTTMGRQALFVENLMKLHLTA